MEAGRDSLTVDGLLQGFDLGPQLFLELLALGVLLQACYPRINLEALRRLDLGNPLARVDVELFLLCEYLCPIPSLNAMLNPDIQLPNDLVETP